MRLRVSECAEEELLPALNRFLRGLSSLDQVFEFTLFLSSPAHAQRLPISWRAIDFETFTHYSWSPQFPRLVSIALYLKPVESLPRRLQHLGKLAQALGIATRLDPEAYVVGQDFCAFQSPEITDRPGVFFQLEQLLEFFRDQSLFGDLGHPPAGSHERLYRLDANDIPDLPSKERFVWESELSVNEASCLFAAPRDFSLQAQGTRIANVIGYKWQGAGPDRGFLEWTRTVGAPEQRHGEEVLTLAGPYTPHRYCISAAETAEHFGLLRSEKVFRITLFSHSKQYLCVPSASIGNQAGKASPGPSLPIWRNLAAGGPLEALLAIGIRFAAK